MDIKSWKIMLAVDDYGSFTRVGAELGYTQSGITQTMKNLEKKAGFPLYIKDHHGIKLTNEAKSLIPAIRALLNADEVIHQEIAALNGAQKGTIRIGTYLSCSIHWIPKIIREFQQTHPDIIIQVIEGVEGELADWIQERRVDIGFISLQKNHSYQFLPVMDDPMYVVVPENDPLAKEEFIPIEALEGAPFIITEYTPGSDVHRVLKKYKIHPDIRYVTRNEFSSLSMVEHELGYSLLPGLLLRGQQGKFVKRPLKPAITRQLGLAYSPSKTCHRLRKHFWNTQKIFYWTIKLTKGAAFL